MNTRGVRRQATWVLTLLPVEILERGGVGPLPASLDVPVVEANPQGGAVTSQQTYSNTRRREISEVSNCSAKQA